MMITTSKPRNLAERISNQQTPSRLSKISEGVFSKNLETGKLQLTKSLSLGTNPRNFANARCLLRKFSNRFMRNLLKFSKNCNHTHQVKISTYVHVMTELMVFV